MSFRATANGLFVASLLTALVTVARSQIDSPEATTVTGCLTERSGKLILPGNGDNYLLEGHAAELRELVGDEVSVTGNLRAGSAEGPYENVLAVASFRTIVRKNPAGVQARLGDPSSWSAFRDKRFGVAVRYPQSFRQQEVEQGGAVSDFVDQSGVVNLQGWDIPREAYPGSNFAGGGFAIAVAPAIRSEGTCRQFGQTTPGHTFSRTWGGIRYEHALSGGAAAGTAYMTHYLHTFHNGFCYEFRFEFAEFDGTGLDEPCSIQWLTRDNEEKLIASVLSQALFAAPETRNAGRSMPAEQPLVVSLTQSLVKQTRATDIVVSWSTKGADYVQLRYPCVDRLFVSGERGSEMKCGISTNRNFPANGSESVLLSNFNSRSVRFVLTVEPFSDGIGYHGGSKTITVEIPAASHPPMDGFRPSLQ